MAPSENEPKKQISYAYGTYVIFTVVLSDLVIYGTFIPLFATYAAGWTCGKLFRSAGEELICTCVFTFLFIYAVLYFVGETPYWKHLFAFESFYKTLLEIRDMINFCVLIFYLWAIGKTLEAIVNQDKAIKEIQLSEGVWWVFWKTLFGIFGISEGALDDWLGVKKPHKGTLMDPNFGHANEKYEHGALFMLLWAFITACVAKLIYFNTLFTYLRAMQIFVSMKPIFSDDDEFESNTTFYSMQQSRQSRLENDFARSVKKPNWVEEDN